MTGVHKEKTFEKKERIDTVPVNILDIIMRHLALFSYPVQESVLEHCPDLAERLRFKNDKFKFKENKKILNTALDQLSTLSLVIKINPSGYSGIYDKQQATDLKNEKFKYILHRKISAVVSEDMGYVTEFSQELAPYRTTLYCEQSHPKGVPRKEHFNLVERIIKSILDKTDLCWPARSNEEEIHVQTDSNFPEKFYIHSANTRAAYAILRGSFTISSIARMDGSHAIETENHPPFEAYRVWIRDIINSSIRLTKHRKKLLKEKNISEKNLSFNLPFYRDEVAWLYNEKGLISFIQGRLFDALPLYRQALRVIDGSNVGVTNQAFYSPKRRIQLNLALAEIEQGNIQNAVKILKSIMSQIILDHYSTPSSALIYARGYRGLCDHLTGNFVQAEKFYKKTIEDASDRGQLRVISIFQRHWADLMRVQNRLEEARQLILLSEKSAGQANQEDILHYALLAKARLMRDMDEKREALHILRRSEDYAHRMGLDKMMVETLKVRGEVMLSEGEVTQAGRVTAQAVALAKRNGMRLRKISASLVQAKIYQARGQKEFALQILDDITIEAGKLGYTLKLDGAQQLKHDLRISI
ncbi:MAG: hypothetical protein R3F02_20300 [Thiolinea sp.]